MTDKQPAQFDWATELSDAQGRVTLSEQEAHEIGARLRSIGEKLKTYEDLGDAGSDVQLLRMGYEAARLEIESLQARVKTMAEEHADELMVAHLDGMRAAQPASGLDPELGPMLDFANAGEIAFYDYAVAQHCRATLDILDGKDNGAGACNEPWASVRKRLLSIVELHQSSSATQGGFVPAGVQQPGTAYADLMQEASDWICEHVQNETTGAMMWAIRLQSAAQKLRASHGQAPSQAAPQQEAQELDAVPETGADPQTIQEAAAELRRLHAYCQELEAQVILDCMTHIQNPAPQPTPTPQADSQPAGADRHGLPPLPDPDLRDVGTNPEDIKNFLRGYATEYAKVALAARAPAYSVLEDAAQVEIDLFNDLNRIYGNTLTAYAKEMCRLGYRKTNAARKQGANHD